LTQKTKAIPKFKTMTCYKSNLPVQWKGLKLLILNMFTSTLSHTGDIKYGTEQQ
jgi:hypothetical protein